MTADHPTPQHPWIAALTVAAALFASSVAEADDAALYGPKAPPGSTFVRVFNASGARLEGASVGPETLATVNHLAASDYVFLPAGKRVIRVGGQTIERDLQAGRYYTVVQSDRGVSLHELSPPDSRLKALIVLYNHTDADRISLRTADGKTTVVDAASGKEAARAVNPVKVPMALYAGDRELEQVREVALKRGQAFNLFVVGSAEKPTTRWVID